ncbi:MAG: hypothetical protein E7056_00330 [Lentisphaerae bacterium]|nr:hypothetical protein [Lentisphaerota bacterium]
MAIYSYNFNNKKRDLSDILSTVIKDEPRFISNFKTVAEATAQKHEWLEDQIVGRSVAAVNVVNSTVTFDANDIAKLKVGTLLVVKNDPALFRITAINGNDCTFELAGANGSEKAMPATGDVLNIVSSPMAEGSVNGDGEATVHQSNSEYNYMQIFRKDIVLTGSALAINVYGSIENQINRQTAFALGELARDLNRVALFGVRREPGANVRGEAGGLYSFASGLKGLSVDGEGLALDSFMINDAAQNILSEGGEPMQILCSPGQARVLSNEYKPSLQILRSDERRGAYVATIVNEISGRGMTIMADPDVPDSDVWVMDTAGFGLANLKGRAISDIDATPQGFDGIKRMALGELTFEFKNAKQRLCCIHNIKPSADALKAMRNA